MAQICGHNLKHARDSSSRAPEQHAKQSLNPTAAASSSDLLLPHHFPNNINVKGAYLLGLGGRHYIGRPLDWQRTQQLLGLFDLFG